MQVFTLLYNVLCDLLLIILKIFFFGGGGGGNFPAVYTKI